MPAEVILSVKLRYVTDHKRQALVVQGWVIGVEPVKTRRCCRPTQRLDLRNRGHESLTAMKYGDAIRAGCFSQNG